MRLRGSPALALLVVGLGVPRLAFGAADAARVRIELSPELGIDQKSRIDSAIRAQVADVASVTDGAPVNDADTVHRATVIVRVEPTPSGLAVTLADAAGRSPAKRRTIEGDDEVAASAAGAIARAFVVALSERADERSEPRPEPAARPSFVPPLPRDTLQKPAERSALRLGAFYTGSTFAPTLPWQSGARVEASIKLATVAYVGAGYAFHPAAAVTAPEASVRITRHAPGLFAGLETQGDTLAFGADLGVAIDATLRATTATSSGLASTGDSTHASPAFTLRGHARLRASGRGGHGGLALDLAPTVELAPGGRSMVVDGAGPTVLLAPSVARFRLDLGGTFDGF